ncbi:hypothetical protein HTZ77_18570 [Nonomuraea sp. SMC257]|uniref:Uncharacterized protein n=1 Tax=Nonomuraea montanisoli TaxID=2741721 RepID=A0A7Y6I871_9ACTN|nr:hypothetical protein [Nonomuraea montanisoli]NUW33419.1 hypothetical protein [Nonomuraea montanisoli]
MSEPAPLPPAQTDPAVTAASAAQAAYAAKVDAARSDAALSDLGRAEAIVQAYEEHGAELQRLAEDLHGRRVARLNHLQAQIPTGPGIPTDASPADAAVLQTAFRAHLEAARQASPEKRQQMLADALRFGDDVQARAVLTAGQDAGHTKLIDQWADATGKRDLLTEIRALNEELAGHGPGRAWVGQAFRGAKRPPETFTLPALRQEAEKAAQDAARARRPVYYG